MRRNRFSPTPAAKDRRHLLPGHRAYDYITESRTVESETANAEGALLLCHSLSVVILSSNCTELAPFSGSAPRNGSSQGLCARLTRSHHTDRRRAPCRMLRRPHRVGLRNTVSRPPPHPRSKNNPQRGNVMGEARTFGSGRATRYRQPPPTGPDRARASWPLSRRVLRSSVGDQ